MTGFELLVTASRTASAEASGHRFLERVGWLLANYLDGAVDIAVGHSDLDEGFQWAGGEAPTSPAFHVSQEIAVRGTVYGRLEARSAHAGRAAGAVDLAPTIALQIARYFELAAVRCRQQRLLSELERAEKQLRTEKALARATGIVAATRQITREAAEFWLQAESRRAGQSLAHFAQWFVARAKRERDLARAAWGELRRIA